MHQVVFGNCSYEARHRTNQVNDIEFVKIVRDGSDKLRVDDIVIDTGSVEVHGKGMLQITRESFKLHVTLDDADVNKLPKMRTGIYTKKDNWKMTGLIEDQLKFKCDQFRPFLGGGLFPIKRFAVKFRPIDLIPSGWDAISRAERTAFVKEHQAIISKPPAESEPPVPDENSQDDFCFYATLFEYDVPLSVWQDEIKAETKCFNVTLKKLEGTTDLHVSLISQKEFSSGGEEQDWKRFYAFMSALAFVTGMHAWPYRVEYWRAGQKITDRITAAHSLSETIHAPFCDTLAFNAKTGSVKWSFPETIKVIADFYDNEFPFTKEIAYLHFLFRQATETDVHGDISILALCILFENLVRHIFRELKLEINARNENPIFGQFEQAKETFIKQMGDENVALDEGSKRLLQTIKSAEPFNVKAMFQTIVSHFKLTWDDDMELIFETWKNARNPLVHRGEYGNRSEDEVKEIRIAESRIAGAINILSLKLFGYSGYMRHSTFEDGYRQI